MVKKSQLRWVDLERLRVGVYSARLRISRSHGTLSIWLMWIEHSRSKYVTVCPPCASVDCNVVPCRVPLIRQPTSIVTPPPMRQDWGKSTLNSFDDHFIHYSTTKSIHTLHWPHQCRTVPNPCLPTGAAPEPRIHSSPSQHG